MDKLYVALGGGCAEKRQSRIEEPFSLLFFFYAAGNIFFKQNNDLV